MIKGGNIVEYGVNKRRHLKDKSIFHCSVHAEVDLLNKVGDKAKGGKIYLYRFNNTTAKDAREVKNAKPCPMCQHELKKAGVARIFHVDDDGDLQVIKNRNLVGLVGEPANITKHFLHRYGDDYHGKFAIMQFVT